MLLFKVFYIYQEEFKGLAFKYVSKNVVPWCSAIDYYEIDSQN